MVDPRHSLKFESIRDVISILDTAFLSGNELHPGYRGMQVANRGLIAHFAIEKGFKAGLEKTNLPYPKSGRRGHDLHHLYQLTKQIDGGTWAGTLADAFEDAVSFYEYDVELVPYVATLDEYLGEVGSHKAFVEMRYWLEDSPTIDDVPESVTHVLLHLHKEILEALGPLFAFDQKRLVSDRVERVVADAVTYVLGYGVGTPEEQASEELGQWLGTKPSYRVALREAVQKDYIVQGVGELGRQKLRQAFESLSAQASTPFSRAPSEDPAVAFYIGSCGDLPTGYRSQYPDAQVSVKWVNESHTFAKVFSPAGEPLGHIQKHLHSRWFSNPYIKRGILCREFDDAEHWLVSQQCERVVVTSGDQSARQLYVYSPDRSFASVGVKTNPGWSDLNEPREFEVGFWDSNHDLVPGREVSLTSRLNEKSKVGNRLEGVVSKVEAHKVWITGRSIFDLVE